MAYADRLQYSPPSRATLPSGLASICLVTHIPPRSSIPAQPCLSEIAMLCFAQAALSSTNPPACRRYACPLALCADVGALACRLLFSPRWPRSFCHSWQRPLFGHVQLLYERDIAHSYPFVPVRIRFRVVVRAEAAYFFLLGAISLIHQGRERLRLLRVSGAN